MERLGIIVLFLSGWLTGNAQLTFDSSIFPGPGDSLTYQKDVVNQPDNFFSGPNQTWDFRFLETPLYETERFSPSPFIPDPKKASSTFLKKSENLQLICQNSEDGHAEIGFLIPTSQDHIVIPVYFDKPMVWDPSTLDYGESIMMKSSFDVTLRRDQLPRRLARDITSSLNSLRVKGTRTVIRHSEAWGSLSLPGETIRANRVRVSEMVQVRIYDGQTGKFIANFDEDMIRMIIPFKTRRKYYEFYSKTFPFVSARILVDDQNKLSSIDFQSRKYRRDRVDATSRGSDFILFPNPTYNIAKVFIKNQPKGSYALSIYNIIGKQLWKRVIEVDGETMIKENFGFLPKGTYLISLLDENGNILKTTRLIIVSV